MSFGYFPELYPDELLYSACARYQSHLGSRNQKSHIQRLFGIQSCCAITDFPSHIGFLANRISTRENSIDSLIHLHTTYPYYHPFLPEETSHKIKQYMISDNRGNRIHTSLGINATSVPISRYLKYCCKCSEEDVRLHGTTYWRRIHQLPGVNVCYVHSIVLVPTKVLVSTSRGKHRFIDLNTIYQDYEVQVTGDLAKEMVDLAKQSSELVSFRNDNSLSKDIIRAFYLEQLESRGYMTVAGRVRFKLLSSDFIDFYSFEFLQQLNSNISTEDSWLHKVIRRSEGNCHPVRHLLLLKFLGFSIAEVNVKGRVKPFGDAPWPCLNKAAPHYREVSVKQPPPCHKLRAV